MGNSKRDVSDNLLILIAIALFGISIYYSLTAESPKQTIKIILFLIATALFGFKGYELNRLKKQRDNLPELNFFQYYDEALNILWKYKVIDMQIFILLLNKEKIPVLEKQRLKTNLVTICMYVFLVIAIIL